MTTAPAQDEERVRCPCCGAPVKVTACVGVSGPYDAYDYDPARATLKQAEHETMIYVSYACGCKATEGSPDHCPEHGYTRACVVSQPKKRKKARATAAAEGWVLVPREPTEAMISAMADHWPHGGKIVPAMLRLYRAAIAAAPGRDV